MKSSSFDMSLWIAKFSSERKRCIFWRFVNFFVIIFVSLRITFDS